MDQWLQYFGSHAPELTQLARRLLSQPACASSCERCWSAYDFIHNKRRNRLTAERARKLVDVFTNRKLAYKFAQGQAAESFLPWEDMVEDPDMDAE
mgnify:CR=1 FL=1